MKVEVSQPNNYLENDSDDQVQISRYTISTGNTEYPVFEYPAGPWRYISNAVSYIALFNHNFVIIDS